MESGTCPECQSENIIFSKKRQRHECEDCDYSFPIKKPFDPLRIFLSYGHDANEELVLQIKSDLEFRGHDVWLDKNEIKFGDDWRRSITDGIIESNRVLAFLSKHSTRNPGVCLDEIAIAIGVRGGNIQTILVESEEEVRPPASISYIQWLDMHDWKEHRSFSQEAWGNWYKDKFDEIVRVVECEESRRFAGEIEKLKAHLKPISPDSRISTLLRKGFVGREWLTDEIENWRSAEECNSRLFWITGAPGVGKSALAAHLAHFGSDRIIAAQFVEWDKPDHRDAERVVKSLAFQLATRLPDYRKFLLTLPEIEKLDHKGHAELFDYLLGNPLNNSIQGGRERYIIVIDALDEAGEGGGNPLVEMIARHAPDLPDWLCLVVTSRPESAVTTPMQNLNPLLIDANSEANRADLREYLFHQLASNLKNRPNAEQLVEQILNNCEGVFLYLERFCEDVQSNTLSLDHPDQFPKGLGGVYFQWFKRQFPDLGEYRKTVRPALRAILAACEPLPVDVLQGLFNWEEECRRDFTSSLGAIFPVQREGYNEVIKPCHKSLADWLTTENTAGPFFVSLSEGNRLLADKGWNYFKKGLAMMPAYFHAHLPRHLFDSKRVSDFCELSLFPAYTDSRRMEHGIVDILTLAKRILDDPNALSNEQKEELGRWLQSTHEDVFGKIMHEKWLQDVDQENRSLSPELRACLCPWAQLALENRVSRWRDATEIVAILGEIHLKIRLAASSPPNLYQFAPLEIEFCADSEHKRWCREKIAEKWTYSSTHNFAERKSPFLVPFSELPEDVQRYDIHICRSWPEMFAKGGYEIVRDY